MECSMSERRPRVSKKLNLNDRAAMARMMIVLLRNCTAGPPRIETFSCICREQEEGHFRNRCKCLIF